MRLLIYVTREAFLILHFQCRVYELHRAPVLISVFVCAMPYKELVASFQHLSKQKYLETKRERYLKLLKRQ